ncbi:thiamine pyrophosphate-binding protein [Leucobacter sp. HY1910]
MTIDPHNTGLAIMRTVRGYGVDTVFGIPGTHNLEFYRPVESLGMRAVTSRHEQGAGYAADAWAQRTGLPGVILTTSGPGLLNALSAAGTAYCESRPMLILAPGVPRGREGSTSGMLHETKNQLAAAAAIVDHAVRVSTVHEAVEAVHEAFARAQTGRPRPTYIEVPLDLLEEAVDVDESLLLPRAVTPETVHGGLQQADLQQAAELLGSAKRPAIIAGAGARRGRESLARLAEMLGAPVVTSSNGKGVLAESHALSIGADLRLGTAVSLLNEADVLLVVGTKLAEGEFAAGELQPGGSVIRIDIDAAQARVNLQADLLLVGDAGDALPALEAGVASIAREARVPWRDLTQVRKECLAEADRYGAGIGEVSRRIAAALPPGTIITGDSSQICYAGMASHFRVTGPAESINMTTYATLGYGLPAAIGAKLASPERPVVCVTGDGALMFSVSELQTASEQGLNLTVVCVDNGGYGEIEQNEVDRDMPPIAVRLTQPNWPLLADAYGGRGFAVASAHELEARVNEALAYEGVALVHVPMRLFM